jgi:hypothetical protein
MEAKIALIAAYFVGFNVALTGISKGLELIKDKTSNTADNKLYDIICKVTSVLQKIVDAAGFNPEHK